MNEVINETTNEMVTKDKEIIIMEQVLNGVMFHLFYIDLFTLINLDGFKRIHEYQKTEEENRLNKIKERYIHQHKKLPVLHPESINYWDKYEKSVEEEDIEEIVEHALEDYCDWENQALQNFVKWKEYDYAKDVMREIDRVKYIMVLLDKDGWSKENIEFLSRQLK